VGFVDKESELGKRYLEKRNTSVFYQEAVFFSTPEVCQYLRDAGFDDLTFKQTLIPSEREETIREGFGQGAFVPRKESSGDRGKSANSSRPFPSFFFRQRSIIGRILGFQNARFDNAVSEYYIKAIKEAFS
jgi:hypothetical protein